MIPVIICMQSCPLSTLLLVGTFGFSVLKAESFSQTPLFCTGGGVGDLRIQVEISAVGSQESSLGVLSESMDILYSEMLCDLRVEKVRCHKGGG